MTTDDLSKLTLEQKRVRVAELCGVKCARCEGTGHYMRFGEHEWFRQSAGNQNAGNAGKQKPVPCDHVTPDMRYHHGMLIPDYLRDLNSTALMEETLNAKEACEYSVRLRVLLDHDFRAGNPLGIAGYIWHATSAQRVDAFLLTKG